MVVFRCYSQTSSGHWQISLICSELRKTEGILKLFNVKDWAFFLRLYPSNHVDVKNISFTYETQVQVECYVLHYLLLLACIPNCNSHDRPSSEKSNNKKPTNHWNLKVWESLTRIVANIFFIELFQSNKYSSFVFRLNGVHSHEHLMEQ